jgi:hypothetical protein
VAVAVDVDVGLGGADVGDVPVEPPIMTAPVLDPAAVPVAVPPIVPVHAAPTGQHATFPAASLAQTWFVGQHAPLLPRDPQLLYPPGHPCRLNSFTEKSLYSRGLMYWEKSSNDAAAADSMAAKEVRAKARISHQMRDSFGRSVGPHDDFNRSCVRPRTSMISSDEYLESYWRR